MLSKDVKGKKFALGTEKRKILGTLTNKVVENLDDHRYPKIKDLVHAKPGKEMEICSGYPLRHKTTFHCSERRAKMLNNRTMHHWKNFVFGNVLSVCTYLKLLIRFSFFPMFIKEKMCV